MNDDKTLEDFKNEENRLDIEKVIKTYNNYIYTVVRNLISNEEDVEEILSDVFTILWKNYTAMTLNSEIKIKPYLIGITKNLIKKKYKNQNALESLDSMDVEIPDVTDVSKLAENNEKSKLILEVQNEMKEEEREIFIMFYYQNKKVREIAKILKISTSKVKVKLHRLRNLVKKKFKERGYSYGR